MKLSIIIPVFNVERTLQRCIESVQRQSFQDFEMILVDDGTKDRSGKIADEMAADDNRITVIHQSNQGLSEARNTGIDKARENTLPSLIPMILSVKAPTKIYSI